VTAICIQCVAVWYFHLVMCTPLYTVNFDYTSGGLSFVCSSCECFQSTRQVLDMGPVQTVVTAPRNGV